MPFGSEARFTTALTTLAVAAVCVVVWANRKEETGTAGRREALLSRGLVLPGHHAKVPDAKTLGRWYATGHTVGPTDAVVRIVECGNYTCEFCRQLHQSLATLMKKYPDQLRVTWMHNAPPVDRPGYGTSLDWAIASECAGDQDSWQKFHDRAFSRAMRVVARSTIRELARESGVGDLHRFEACLDVAEPLAVIEAQTADARRPSV